MGILSQLRYWPRRLAAEAASGNPFYLPCRVTYAVKRHFVDWAFSFAPCWRRGGRLSPAFGGDPAELMKSIRHRTTPVFHFQTGDIEKIVSETLPEEKNSLIERSDDLVRRRFAFRGLQATLLDPIGWDVAPSNHAGWRRDLNRHFYFAQLGFAYWHTRDARFATTFVELSSSWIEENAHLLGKLSWDDPFEVAARINAWIWAYFLFLDCPHWDAPRHKQFLNALGRLCEYLYQVIEYHRPGNHILLEAKALALCSGLFPEFENSPRWAKKAWRILKREVREQILPDGVHAERSTMYHRIIAGELGELLLFCLRNGLDEARELAPVVSKMAQFESCITSEKGSVPLFGDAYADDSYIRFSAPAIVASLTGHATGLSRPAQSTDQTLWALGGSRPGFEPGLFPASLGQGESRDFSDGGYYVSRTSGHKGTSLLVWDCGPLGYKANFVHSHLDALSFFLALDGEPILVDPGTNEIEADKRRYLRGTAAHNTVQIDGEEQSIRSKDDRICRPARADVVYWGTSPECDVMIGTHDGYERLAPPASHIRTIISMKNQYWLVFDRVEGQGVHTAEQRFHVSPGSTVRWTDQHLEIEQDEIRLALVPIEFRTESRHDRDQYTEIDAGFVQFHFDRHEPAAIVRTAVTAPVPFSLAACLCPLTPSACEVRARALETASTPGFQRIEIIGTGFNDTIFFALGRKLRRELLRGCETDARLVILRRGHDRVVTHALLADASTLVQHSVERITADKSCLLHKIAITTGGLFEQ